MEYEVEFDDYYDNEFYSGSPLLPTIFEDSDEDFYAEELAQHPEWSVPRPLEVGSQFHAELPHRVTAKEVLEEAGDDGLEFYTHLKALVNKAIQDNPVDFADFFEQYSRELREKQNVACKEDDAEPCYYEPYRVPRRLKHSKRTLKLIDNLSIPQNMESSGSIGDDLYGEEEEKPILSTDVTKQLQLMEEAGITIPQLDAVKLHIAIRKLSQVHPVSKARFWGIIYGIQKNYYIVECEFPEEEILRRMKDEVIAILSDDELQYTNMFPTLVPPVIINIEESQEPSNIGEQTTQEELRAKAMPSKLDRYVIPDLPKPVIPEILDIPKEGLGSGANQSVYFVCNTLGDDWVLLPDVQPQHIIVARKIAQYFTGNLQTKIDQTLPKFPGLEKHYLRAQIARISAGTHISPLGWYMIGGDEENSSDQALHLNPHYDTISVEDLTEPTMKNWVHHKPYILSQGRTVWWAPYEPIDEEAGEAEEEDKKQKPKKFRETGPSLLNSLSEDSYLDHIPPWHVRGVSSVLPDNNYAVVRSNLWRGAYAVSNGHTYDLIYIGWGLKLRPSSYSPPPMRAIQTEYDVGPEVMEIMDPTPEDEAEWVRSHFPYIAGAHGGEGEIGEEGFETNDEDLSEMGED